jgi:hypothetical protein
VILRVLVVPSATTPLNVSVATPSSSRAQTPGAASALLVSSW